MKTAVLAESCAALYLMHCMQSTQGKGTQGKGMTRPAFGRGTGFQNLYNLAEAHVTLAVGFTRGGACDLLRLDRTQLPRYRKGRV